MRLVLLSCLCLMIFPAAGEDDSKAALRDFGILGTWSADCAKPVSGDNRYFTYAAPATGRPTTRSTDGKTPFDGFINEARIIDRTKLRIHFQAQNDPKDTRVIVHEKLPGNRIRISHATMSAGNVVIADGKIVGANPPKETPALEKCRE